MISHPTCRRRTLARLGGPELHANPVDRSPVSVDSAMYLLTALAILTSTQAAFAGEESSLPASAEASSSQPVDEASATATDVDSVVETIGDDFKISGSIPNIRHQARCGRHRFEVVLQDLRYAGTAERTLLERKQDSLFTIWIALKDVSLTINRISVSGTPGSAVCGPTSIEMGRRRELWMAFDFEQREGEKTHLVHTGTRFGLPDDNWSVGTPAWVRTSGFGMSRDRVVGGIRKGLAANHERLEQEVLQFAPDVLARFAAPDKALAEGKTSLEEAVLRKLAAGGHLPDLAMTGS